MPRLPNRKAASRLMKSDQRQPHPLRRRESDLPGLSPDLPSVLRLRVNVARLSPEVVVSSLLLWRLGQAWR